MEALIQSARADLHAADLKYLECREKEPAGKKHTLFARRLLSLSGQPYAVNLPQACLPSPINWILLNFPFEEKETIYMLNQFPAFSAQIV